MESSIELMTGICFLVMGVSLLFRPQEWANWAEHLKANGTNSALVLGMVNLLLGTVIIAFHWVWAGLGMIVTIFGVLFVMRGSVLLLFPRVFAAVLALLLHRFVPLFRVSGLAVAGLGGLILYHWCVQSGWVYAG